MIEIFSLKLKSNLINKVRFFCFYIPNVIFLSKNEKVLYQKMLNKA